MAKSIDMSFRTMRRLVHKDLKMSSLTLQKRQTLSAAVKQKRLERSKVFLKKFRSARRVRLFNQMRRSSELNSLIIEEMIVYESHELFGVLRPQSQIHCEKIHYSVDDLKQSLLRAWQEIPQEQLRAFAKDVRRRLPAVIKSNESHFE